ncbi:MAG: hypothetical protein ACRDLF_01110 [Solirubrobacteraceae bacterium]
MKQLKIAGLCLVSMFVMSMALAGNAAAALLWLVCLESTGLTKYSSNQCTEASSTGKWQSLGLPSGVSDTVRLLAFSLRLADTGAKVIIECPDPGTTGWGLIEGPNKGQVKVAKVENPNANCKILESGGGLCKEITVIEGGNLPWKTEIFTTEKRSLTRLLGTNNEAGWRIVCSGVEDRCLTVPEEPESLELVNGVTKGVLLVLARFEQAAKAKCSLFGGRTGLVLGLAAVLLWNGNGLSINNE